MSPYEVLKQYFKENESTQSYVLGYSGGLDSSVLLHAMAKFSEGNTNFQFKCVHINHGLQKEADAWQKHCKETASKLGVEFQSFQLNESCPRGESLEAWARAQRYSIFQSLLDANTALITAHHQDDQVETFFLNLFRGSGVAGLSSMPTVKILGQGLHVRPLLALTRADLEQYAQKNDLTWIEDPSNKNEDFDRNYLRNKLLPSLQGRWQGLYKIISATSRRMQDTQKLLQEMAEQDLKQCLNSKGALSLILFKQLSLVRQKNLLLHWPKKNYLDIPGQRHVEQCLSNLCLDNESMSGCVSWGNTELRRYRDYLYLMSKQKEEKNDFFQWNIYESKKLPSGKLSATIKIGKGLKKELFSNETCEIRFRQGGESIYCENNGTHVDVKNLFQEFGVLPWYRNAIPLIYLNDELAHIPGIMTNTKFIVDKENEGVDITLNGFEMLCQ